MISRPSVRPTRPTRPIKIALRARRVDAELDPGGRGKDWVGKGLGTVRARLDTVRARLATVRSFKRNF